MSNFNQDIENLLNAYDSNWDDYLILREQFIEKYSLSVDKLQEQLNTAKKAFEYIINSDDMAFGFVNSNLRRYIEKTLAALEGGEYE